MSMSMRRVFAVVAGVVVAAQGAVGQVDDVLEQADEHYEEERYERSAEILERAESRAESGGERAEVYWRLSRVQLGLGDDFRDEAEDEDSAIEAYNRGIDYGDQAIEADGSNNLGYYWKASNLGRWGETRGILSSLRQAKPMRNLLEESIERDPRHSQSYYVLGLLYAKVPGGFVSFGNTDYAVSLARKARELHLEEVESGEEEMYYPVRFELASHLSDRGWSRSKREREQETKRSKRSEADGVLERSFYFEGTVSLPPMSDEEEARDILEDVVDELEGEAQKSSRERRQLERARELLEEL